MSGTILKLGYTNPLTDVFGAHPQLGAVLDLNDGSAFTLASPDGLEMPAPPRTLVLAGNIRTQGEVATRSITRHNRMVTAQLYVGPSSSSSALLASIRTLLLWLAAPPQTPITLMYQPFNGSAPVYLDVVGAAHNLPSDEGMWLRGQFEPVTLTFTCRPGMRGDRVTLQNLVPNAGMEQPAGGAGNFGAQPLAFNDLFANTNLYTVTTTTYAAAVLADSPLRYYRLGEAQGATTATDSGSGASNGTYNASGGGTISLHATGILGGGNDSAATFSGAATSDVTAAGSGLPVGNSAFTLECWVNFASNPVGSVARLATFGASATNQSVQLSLTTTGKAQAQFQAGTAITSAATLTLNTWHHVACTWDGTTLTLYVDGANAGTLTPGAANLGAGSVTLAANLAANGNWYAGTLDEVALYATALSSARLLAHYNAGPGSLPTIASNQMTLAAGNTVTFGSPAWGAVAQWQIRFLFATGLTGSFALHYVNASNVLYAQVTSTQLAIVHTVGGVQHILATQSFAALTNGVGYFLQVTQYPAAPNEVAVIQAVLSLSSGGAPGTVLATAGPIPTFDGGTALSGPMGITASGASLVFGGVSGTTTVNGVSLFGPGGWGMTAHGTTMGSGAWEQTLANTYPGGPVASLGALRIDAPAAGAWDTSWRLYLGGNPSGGIGGTFAIAAAPGQTFAGSVWLRSSGLGATATLSLIVREYDGSGNQLRSGTLASTTGNQPAWVQLAGTYTTGAGCVWVDLACDAADASSQGYSGGGIVWYDNALLWNQTSVQAKNPAQTTMPWCDLRAACSPATLVVSGLLGDLPTPAHLGLGSYLSSWPAGGTLSVYVGRKGMTSPNAQLVGVSYGAFSAAYSPQSSASADSGSYGGWYSSATVGVGGWNTRFVSPTAADAPGVYHLLARILSAQSGGNLPNISLRVATAQQDIAWFTPAVPGPAGGDVLAAWFGAYTYPFSASNTWTIADAGQCVLPPFPQGALTDPTQTYLTPRAQWQDISGGGGAAARTNWQALLPVDGSLLVATVNNPSNGAGTIATSWLWVYSDGLLLNRAGSGDGPAWLYSIESMPTPNPGKGAGGAGTQNTGSVNVNSGADPALLLDPQLSGANGNAGVNQLVGVISDQAGSVLPLYGEVSYSPLYLEPR